MEGVCLILISTYLIHRDDTNVLFSKKTDIVSALKPHNNLTGANQHVGNFPGGQPAGCWAQTAGGYGDGVGTGSTGGHWIIEDSAFLYNTSDGLDLLYVREEGSSIEIRRTIAEGNAGNGFKATGLTHIESSIIVGSCGFFDGQPFTFNVERNGRSFG